MIYDESFIYMMFAATVFCSGAFLGICYEIFCYRKRIRESSDRMEEMFQQASLAYNSRTQKLEEVEARVETLEMLYHSARSKH